MAEWPKETALARGAMGPSLYRRTRRRETRRDDNVVTQSSAEAIHFRIGGVTGGEWRFGSDEINEGQTALAETRCIMRFLILSLLAAGVLATANAAPAAAEPDYPWCTSSQFGGQKCSFTSYEQCHATAYAGYCFENPLLLAARAERQPSQQTAPGRRRHRDDR